MRVLLLLSLLLVAAVVISEELTWMDLSSSTDELMMISSSQSLSPMRRRRGRPRKFGAPSRAITLTLPEAVLATLAKINGDPSRAIVQLVKRRGASASRQPLAELAVFGRRAVIVVKPTPAFEEHTGVELVPFPDGRGLLAFDQTKSTADLELRLLDALERAKLTAEDRKIFEAVGEILKDARRSNDVTLFHRSIIVLESTNGSAKGSNGHPAKPGRRKART